MKPYRWRYPTAAWGQAAYEAMRKSLPLWDPCPPHRIPMVIVWVECGLIRQPRQVKALAHRWPVGTPLSEAYEAAWLLGAR